MKILIIGDTHGNISNITHVMGFAKKIRAGAVIHTGDWNTLKSIKTVLDFKIAVYAVLGNADISDEIEDKYKEFLEVKLDGIKIGIIHNIKKLKEDKENFDVIFCGHNHQQRKIGNIINPGALENGINFAIYDTKTKMVEFVSL